MTLTERLARHMFERQAATYDAEPALTELAWTDVEVQAFWLGEATACIDFLATFRRSVGNALVGLPSDAFKVTADDIT